MPRMNPGMTPQDWSDHLRALAAPALAGTPLDPGASRSDDDVRAYIDTFADELGHRRAVDRPILAHLLGVDLEPPALEPAAGIDLRLWWALHHPRAVEGSVASILHPAPGPLLGEAAFAEGAIEITTETELAALHALSHHAQSDPTLLARALDAARWHVDTLQPDNATNHPWAVHVFIQLGAHTGDPARSGEARLHAETLVHNALVASGRPDRFSACLLLDAARVLDRTGR